MELKDLLILCAMFIGPITAIQVQKYMERYLEKRKEKKILFFTLMITRSTRLTEEHVRALNSIELLFQKEKQVLVQWKSYHDVLCHPPEKTETDKTKWSEWQNNCNSKFDALLLSISKVLKYSFDEVDIKRSCYYPLAHETNILENELIRKGLVEFLTGKITIPMKTINNKRAGEEL
jgi:hypothetical protein